ncbi:MAG: peptide ABC transporter substrate-binding protein [Acidimicrobiales bacterium]|nr:peptide ABC transporter substrate-binding protein [Acidimicrobiales bacterium]
MKSTKALLAILFALSFVAAACGGSDEAADGTADDSAVTDDSADDSSADDSSADDSSTDDGAAPSDFEGMSLAAESCDYGGELKSITAVDELTVQFELCFPDVAFESKVAFSAFGIHPSEVLEATGGTGTELLESPVGTGPYQVAQWERGNQLVYTANPNYWGEPANAETLVFRWSEESAQRLVELQSGQVDGIDNPGRDDFEVIAADSDLQLLEREGTNIFYVGFNNTFPPFDNEQVRQAMALGLDRQRLVDNFYPPGSKVADQFLPSSIFGYTPEPTWYDYDPEAAKELLAEAGYPDGFEVTVSYRNVVRSYLPDPATVATDIQAQMADIGVTLNIEEMESGAFLDASDAGELPMYLLGWGADYPDATNFLDFHFGIGASDQFGEKFSDITDLLSEAGQVVDADTRLDLYEQATEALKTHVPMIPVAHGGSGTAFRADVTNAQASPLGNEVFAVMDPGGRDTIVWMQNAEPISLYCADETDGESLRACEQVNESLLAYEVGGTAVQPALAETWSADDTGTIWTFNLRPGVTFHDGSAFDANDVVTTWSAQWDASSPLHTGRDGNFTYFNADFGAFLNAE